MGGDVDSLPPSELTRIQLAIKYRGKLAEDKIIRIYKATRFYL